MAVLSSARAVTLAEAILVDWELARVHDSQRCSEQIVAKLSTSGSQSFAVAPRLFRHFIISFLVDTCQISEMLLLSWSKELHEFYAAKTRGGQKHAQMIAYRNFDEVTVR